MTHLAFQLKAPRGSTSNIRPRIRTQKRKNPLTNQRVFGITGGDGQNPAITTKKYPSIDLLGFFCRRLGIEADQCVTPMSNT
jgi:hypothetical protein